MWCVFFIEEDKLGESLPGQHRVPEGSSLQPRVCLLRLDGHVEGALDSMIKSGSFLVWGFCNVVISLKSGV